MERATAASGADARRRVGRPRTSGLTPQGDVRESILEAALGLFVAQGYAGTTTRQIAAAAGLRQGSLVHYFPRKEHLLGELLDRTVEPALAFLEAGAQHPATPVARLGALVHADCLNLCGGAHNFGRLLLLPEARPPAFRSFWLQRERLRRCYRDLIAEGERSGHLVVGDLDMATDASFGLVESLIMWFDRSSPVTAEAAAVHVTRAVLGPLLADPTVLADLIDEITGTSS